MAKFKVASAGTKDGYHWVRIEKEEGVINLKAFLSTNKELKPGDTIEISDATAKEIKWKP